MQARANQFGILKRLQMSWEDGRMPFAREAGLCSLSASSQAPQFCFSGLWILCQPSHVQSCSTRCHRRSQKCQPGQSGPPSRQGTDYSRGVIDNENWGVGEGKG